MAIAASIGYFLRRERVPFTTLTCKCRCHVPQSASTNALRMAARVNPRAATTLSTRGARGSHTGQSSIFQTISQNSHS